MAVYADEWVRMVEGLVGIPYVLGAEASASEARPKALDCSELVEWAYERAGFPIADGAWRQYEESEPVHGSIDIGDLVFLRNNPRRPNGIGHVGVITRPTSDARTTIIVEARGARWGVVMSTLADWKGRTGYAGVRRVPGFRARIPDRPTRAYLEVRAHIAAGDRAVYEALARELNDCIRFYKTEKDSWKTWPPSNA